jgi:hypothetical protein
MGGPIALFVLLIVAWLSVSCTSAHLNPLHNHLQGRDNAQKPLLRISESPLYSRASITKNIRDQ